MGNEPSKAKHSTTSATSSSRPTATLPFSLKSGPSTALVQRHLDNAKKTRVLQLRGCGMKTVPNPLEDTVSFLRTLDISQNKIKELPPFFTRFSMLKQLSISENRLTELPDEIGNLKTLEVLNVSFNELLTLPDTLVGCASLKTLTATNNKFQTFPVVIAHLPNVESVDLSGNFIERIPVEISTLHATELNLNRNQLNSIDSSLAKCRNLKVLRVEENCLQKKEFSKIILEESRISLIAYAGNLFQDKDFQDLPGYEKYQERFTATKRKGV